jgi:hypothetical protein
MNHNALCTISEENGIITKKKLCTILQQEYRVSVPLDKFLLWKAGALIQDVFPDLSLDDKEFMITGLTPTEWNSIMRDFEESKE